MYICKLTKMDQMCYKCLYKNSEICKSVKFLLYRENITNGRCKIDASKTRQIPHMRTMQWKTDMEIQFRTQKWRAAFKHAEVYEYS